MFKTMTRGIDMRKLAPCLTAAILAGCGATMNPQTRDEYRQAIASGVPLTMTDTYVVQRRFDEVVKSLKQKADECLQVDVTTKRSQGGMTTMNVRDEYRTSVRVVDKSRAELTTQSTMKGAIVVQQVPPGGFFETAVDIERVTPASTKLTYYGPSTSGGKAKWDALKQWSDGKPLACP
jgi:hypothetical protein